MSKEPIEDVLDECASIIVKRMDEIDPNTPRGYVLIAVNMEDGACNFISNINTSDVMIVLADLYRRLPTTIEVEDSTPTVQ